jgi:hypothetical protein
VIRYLESNSDSIPDYGERYRAASRISIGFAESAVNEIIAKRMAKKQQMRWNRYTVQRFLDVRVHVLNGTLEDAFRHWHRGFRPIPTPGKGAAAAYLPTTLHALLVFGGGCEFFPVRKSEIRCTLRVAMRLYRAKYTDVSPPLPYPGLKTTRQPLR